MANNYKSTNSASQDAMNTLDMMNKLNLIDVSKVKPSTKDFITQWNLDGEFSQSSLIRYLQDVNSELEKNMNYADTSLSPAERANLQAQVAAQKFNSHGRPRRR